jgi:hypothetical protein
MRSMKTGILNFFGLLSLFWKNKKCRLIRSPCCPCIIPIHFWMSNQFYKTRYVYHGTWAHLNSVLHKSLLGVCMCSHISLLRNGFIKTYRGNEYRRNNIIVGHIVFYAVHVISEESRGIVLHRTSYLKCIYGLMLHCISGFFLTVLCVFVFVWLIPHPSHFD